MFIFAGYSTSFAQITLNIGYEVPPEHGIGQGIEMFKYAVEDKTNGEVKIVVHPNGVLGNERELAEMVYLGTLDMTAVTPGILSNYEPSVAVLSLPFIFKDWSHIDRVLESPVGEEIADRLLEKSGMRILAYYGHDYRDIFTADRKIVNVEDMKGLKFRVIEAPLYVKIMETWGASPTPMGWNELYTSLQTGVVDAFCNLSQNVYSFKLYEVLKYYNHIDYIWEGAIFIIGEDVWQKISKKNQEIIKKEAWKSGLLCRKYMEVNSTKYDNLLYEEGLISIDVNVDSFREALAEVQFQEKYAEEHNFLDLLDRIREIQ